MNLDDPDASLERLQQIAEEIPSGVRQDFLEHTLQVEYSNELLETTNRNIISAVKQFIGNVWRDFKVSEKLNCLKELEEKSNRTNVWRPVVGEPSINPLVAHSLRKKKQKLEQEIKTIKEETTELCNYLKNCDEKFNTQTNKMSMPYSSTIQENKELPDLGKK